MKPVLIFEHIESSNAGLFADFLEKKSIPYATIRPNHGDAVPDKESLAEFSGLCFLGGTESVVEPTPEMLEEMTLIQAAAEKDLPLIGHCLGGQLISRALGGEVVKHSVEEFGWSQLNTENSKESLEWLPQNEKDFCAMQWHSDTFSIPAEATMIFSGDHCLNQAFVIGNILAMQFHIEIDLKTIRQWAIDLKDKHPPPSASVQSGDLIMQQLEKNYEVSSQLANHLYNKWVTFLKSD